MYESKIKTIAEYYSTNNQLVQLAEESAELTQATLKYRITHCVNPINFEAMRITRQNLMEEMADTLIMIEQLCYLLGCEQVVKDVVALKLDRQLKRIGKAGMK